MAQLPSKIFDELILLSYKTKESKHDLAKTLYIDFEKPEFHEIQQLIKIELDNEPNLKNVNYEIDVYKLGSISFDFEDHLNSAY